MHVYEDTANYFNEVFGGYDVPMDPTMCPFHANNLAYFRDANSLSSWRQARIGSMGRITCPICNKVFTSQDYFDLHLKTHHAKTNMMNYKFSLGQDSTQQMSA